MLNKNEIWVSDQVNAGHVAYVDKDPKINKIIRIKSLN